MLDSNVSFICKLNQFSYIPSHVIVSDDVVSLITNIRFQETNEDFRTHVYHQNDSPKYLLKYLESCCK